jgi:acetyl esterase/lipase
VRLGVVTLLGLLLASASAGAHYRNPTAGSVVALQLPGMHLAKVKRNLQYKGGLGLDVYRPARASGRLPAVVFVHGNARGTDSPKASGVFVGWGQLAAASGLAGVTFDHQEDPEDVVAAVRYVRRNAARLGIDERRICVAGFSAGVQLSMLPALQGRLGALRCAVGYYGPLHAELEQLSPLAYLRADAPATLLAKAGRDNPAINRSIDRYVARAKEVGARVELVVQPTGPHGFETTKDTKTRSVMRRTLDFLRAHLLRAR